jgi:hypothetical protein
MSKKQANRREIVQLSEVPVSGSTLKRPVPDSSLSEELRVSEQSSGEVPATGKRRLGPAPWTLDVERSSVVHLLRTPLLKTAEQHAVCRGYQIQRIKHILLIDPRRDSTRQKLWYLR